MQLKGYNVAEGYMGYVGDSKYMLFACEADYRDYFEVYWAFS